MKIIQSVSAFIQTESGFVATRSFSFRNREPLPYPWEDGDATPEQTADLHEQRDAICTQIAILQKCRDLTAALFSLIHEWILPTV